MTLIRRIQERRAARRYAAQNERGMDEARARARAAARMDEARARARAAARMAEARARARMTEAERIMDADGFVQVGDDRG